MEVRKIIKNRRSIREYLDKPVEEEKLLKIIESANNAPSACNVQGWRFIIVKDKNIKDHLIKKGIVHLKNIPVGIFVIYSKELINKEYQDHIQTASAAIQNMLLTATDLELGSCWVCHLPKKRKLRKLLKIPKIYEPIALITVGYSNETNEMERKNRIQDLVSYNNFNFDYIPKKKYKHIIYKFYDKLPEDLRKFIKILRGAIKKNFNGSKNNQ